MGVQITDCTIRDGGYLLNKNSEPEFVKGIIRGLVESNIDFVEIGFLQDVLAGETITYSNSKDARRHLPEECKKSHYLGFCDNSRYSLNNLDEYDGTSFKWLRISFAKHELDDSLDFCKGAMEKGYLIQFNPMDAISYADEERLSLIQKVNMVKPAALSIVDTFGAMDMTSLVHIFKQIDSLLDREIKIGLHSHDNLGLSSALAERMIELANETERDIMVDGSLYGMGRGAGNAKTELLADYINKYCGGNYDIARLLSTIDTYISPMLTKVHWGYDLPMYICGTMHAHVDNVYHLREKYKCSANEQLEIINRLTPEQRVRYGKGYSKNDFSVLDEAYEAHQKEIHQ